MIFTADNQTISDLGLMGKHKPSSIFSIFNRVRTAGGERLLQEMFQHPLTEYNQINQRSDLFKYFQEKGLDFPFRAEAVIQMEAYFSFSFSGNALVGAANLAWQKLASSFLHDQHYDQLLTGLIATVEVLSAFDDFMKRMEQDLDSPYAQEHRSITIIFSDRRLRRLLEDKNTTPFSYWRVVRYEQLFKQSLQQEMEILLNALYKLDVYLAVSKVAGQYNFHYAKALPDVQSIMDIEGLRHPALVKGVANTVSFSTDRNILFLTGANMAGKSTLMKACGIAVYLAHMGFPVAAEHMSFSVMDGIYSSINVADDLNMGHSHFYAEVLRVKSVAEQVAHGRHLLVLFDELFKGTNVKDAHDGTLLVTAAFSKYRQCRFIVSTHIIEVGQALESEGDNLVFAYLPTVIKAGVPHYTYQLTEGVTADRQGMMIIENEGILELLKSTQ